MDLEEGWLHRQIDRASKEVELWPIPQQEVMLNVQFTPSERYKKTKIRIERLKEEIVKEQAVLDALLCDAINQ